MIFAVLQLLLFSESDMMREDKWSLLLFLLLTFNLNCLCPCYCLLLITDQLHTMQKMGALLFDDEKRQI